MSGGAGREESAVEHVARVPAATVCGTQRLHRRSGARLLARRESHQGHTATRLLEYQVRGQAARASRGRVRPAPLRQAQRAHTLLCVARSRRLGRQLLPRQGSCCHLRAKHGRHHLRQPIVVVVVCFVYNYL